MINADKFNKAYNNFAKELASYIVDDLWDQIGIDAKTKTDLSYAVNEFLYSINDVIIEELENSFTSYVANKISEELHRKVETSNVPDMPNEFILWNEDVVVVYNILKEFKSTNSVVMEKITEILERM